MAISSQIPGACKTGSSERILLGKAAHQEVPYGSIVWKFGVSTFRPHPKTGSKKNRQSRILKALRVGPFGASRWARWKFISCFWRALNFHDAFYISFEFNDLEE